MNKLPTWAKYVAIIVFGLLIIALIRGCRQSKSETEAKEKALAFADSIKVASEQAKAQWDSAAKNFKDSLDFERGQKELIIAQKERTEDQLDEMTKQIRDLLEKHKLAKYTDTTAVLVPNEYLNDCENCFTKLEDQNNLVNRYRNDINKLQDNWDKQNQLYQKRFKELDQEKLGFYNKIQTLAQVQQKELDKLKPHGRLYLSWGVIWKPLPWAAGAGLMYQNKYNLIWGAKWYYGSQGHMIETTINFPLSLKFR